MSQKNYNEYNENEDNSSDNDSIVQVITHTTKEYLIFLDNEIESPNCYREVMCTLKKATEKDSILLIMNSFGGDVDTFIQFYHYITNCKAKIFCELHTAYSAGSMIALCCDGIILNRFATGMAHSISYGDAGKVQELKKRASFENKRMKDMFNHIYDTFLTHEEIDKIMNGGEVWLDAKQIEKRLKKWIPLKDRI